MSQRDKIYKRVTDSQFQYNTVIGQNAHIRDDTNVRKSLKNRTELRVITTSKQAECPDYFKFTAY